MNCDIIKDLLPLYAEQLTTDASNEAIRLHLEQCQQCKKQLEQLQQPQTASQKPNSLEAVRQQLRRRKWLTALFAAFVTAAFLLGVFVWLYQPEYLSAEEAIIGVSEKDGTVEFLISKPQYNIRVVDDSSDPDTGRQQLTICAFTRRWDRLFDHPTERLQPDGNWTTVTFLPANANIWYAAGGADEWDTLLWGSTLSAGRITLPWLGMYFYLYLSIAAAVILSLAYLLLRRKRWSGIFPCLALFFACFALSVVYTTGTQIVVWEAAEKPILFGLALALAALTTGTILVGAELYHIHRSER